MIFRNGLLIVSHSDQCWRLLRWMMLRWMRYLCYTGRRGCWSDISLSLTSICHAYKETAGLLSRSQVIRNIELIIPCSSNVRQGNPTIASLFCLWPFESWGRKAWGLFCCADTLLQGKQYSNIMTRHEDIAQHWSQSVTILQCSQFHWMETWPDHDNFKIMSPTAKESKELIPRLFPVVSPSSPPSLSFLHLDLYRHFYLHFNFHFYFHFFVYPYLQGWELHQAGFLFLCT